MCQRKDCQDERKRLKQDVMEMGSKLNRIETDLRLNGPANARDAEYRRLNNAIERLERNRDRDNSRRASIEKQLRDAEVERLELTRERAALLAEVSLLR